MRQLKSWMVIGMIISFVLIFSNGCSEGSAQSVSPIPPPPTKIFSSNEIQSLLARSGINSLNFIMNDRKYVLAKREWVETEFSRGLAKFQFQFGINNWSEESNDCDKFSSAASFYLKWLNNSSPNHVRAALAAGEIYYIRDKDRAAHAINMFVFDTNGILSVSFYEPQTVKFIKLSESEINSIYFWKL